MGFFAIDVGNTRLKWAFFEGSVRGAEPQAQGAVFLEHIESLAEEAWAGLPRPAAMLGCNVAGEPVRHRVEQQIEAMEGWDITPRWVVPGAAAGGITNGYDHPGRLGADRFVALVGGWHHARERSARGPVLVVMIGTAVTIDAIDAGGRFLGGLILPGHGIMLSSLQGGTAGLRVPTGEVRDFPCNTSDALTSGGTYAITGAIERQARRLGERCGQQPQVIVAGGAGWKVSPHLDVRHEVVEGLIFDGLAVLQQEREARAPASSRFGGLDEQPHRF